MKEVIVYDGQSLLDISVQESGTAENVFAICDANDMEPDDLPIAGSILKIPDFKLSNKEILPRMQKQDLHPATMVMNLEDESDIVDQVGGINYWGIEVDFEVQPNPGDPIEE
jgi:hypothetical protein